jgi:hypothetical protein
MTHLSSGEAESWGSLSLSGALGNWTAVMSGGALPLVRTWKRGFADWPAMAEHVSVTFTQPLLYLSPACGER